MSALPPNSWDPVSDSEALTVDCPLCGRPRGSRCVYMSDIYGYDRYGYRDRQVIKHHKGDPTQRAHNPRRTVYAQLRAVRWKAENKAAAAKLEAIKRGRRAPIARAVAEFDRREAEAIRAWLRNGGEILWKPELDLIPKAVLPRPELYPRLRTTYHQVNHRLAQTHRKIREPHDQRPANRNP